MSEATEFRDDLIEDGFECSFGNYQPHADGGVTDNYIEVIKAFCVETEWQKDFTNNVKANDSFYLVPADVDLEAVTIMVIDDLENIIKEPKRYRDKGEVIGYEIQVRR